MSVRYFRTTLPGIILALSIAGVIPASSINIDDRPDKARTDSDSWSIAGDYTAFDDGSSFFAAGDGSQSEGAITLSFEFTSGYAPDAEIVHAVRSLTGGS